ncbi:hypothetical protein [Streptomyces cinnamoneus]|uniref:hypothetical protein n=1 Tax=Streptomyces cinnamoneus TaxID=53446 RepID=UPI001EFC9078|nr:hypothetical protein [Streptomyces cinnamoneus]
MRARGRFRCSRRGLLTAAAALPLTAAAGALAGDEAPRPPDGRRYFPRHGSYGHRTVSYDLRLDYDPGRAWLEGHARVQAVALEPAREVELDWRA